MASTPPPAANGMIISIGRDGHFCADASWTVVAHRIATAKPHLRSMRSSAPIRFLFDIAPTLTRRRVAFVPESLTRRQIAACPTFVHRRAEVREGAGRDRRPHAGHQL